MSSLLTKDGNEGLLLLDITNKIEKVRQELHGMIDHHEVTGFNDQIVEMSQYLDILLVTYMSKLGRENYEKK